MSPRFRREPFAADHDRARTLAAEGLVRPIEPDDAGWLADHLAWCRPCRAVAAEYEEQRIALRTLRHDQPDPPRDLWARTASAIESDAAYRRRNRRQARPGPRSLVPLTGILAVAIVFGAGLLNGSSLLPAGTQPSEAAAATPIALPAADIQVLGHANDGSLELYTGSVDHVCPVSEDSCGLSPKLDVTQLGDLAAADLASTGQLDAIISPDRDQMVVVARGNGARGVFVVPVKGAESVTVTPAAATATPSTAATRGPDAASPSASTGVTAAGSARPASASPAATPEVQPTASPPEPGTAASSGSPAPSEAAGSAPPVDASASPDTTEAGSEQPSASPTGDTSATPPAESSSPTPSDDSTAPTPSVAVTPGPDGAIDIASDVTVVGSIAGYSPDGTRFAFAAQPADGSTGPDVYVWRVGDRQAVAVTSDHASLFSGWLGARPMVSRVVDGSPRTFILDLDARSQRLAHDGAMWRPSVGPGRRTAIWWDGTVKRSDDGMFWVPDTGRLVLGEWPDAAGGAQVLADGPISDWDARWDDSGTMLAVWIAGDGEHRAGRLSLYSIDPDTGRADLSAPKLDAAPAYAGYSLKPGRLAWSAPKDGGDTTVEVLAWSGDTIVGRLSLPAAQGATIIH